MIFAFLIAAVMSLLDLLVALDTAVAVFCQRFTPEGYG